jgi:uncharacterized membrane protein
MRSRARFLSHPLHPILIIFPASMFPLLLLLDIAHGVSGQAVFWTAGLAVAVVGTVGTVLAALAGFTDYLGIPKGTDARRTASQHLGVGVAVLILYLIDLGVRYPQNSVANVGGGYVVDILGVIGILVQGWLGGELVYRHSLGVLARDEGGEPTPFNTGSPSEPSRRMPGGGEYPRS